MESPGRPGKYHFDFQLDYLLVDDSMLDMPVFEMAKKDPIKRNPPTHATLDEYQTYTQKQQVGKLGELWRDGPLTPPDVTLAADAASVGSEVGSP